MSKHKEVQPQLTEPETKPPDQAWFIPADPEQSVYRFIIAGARRARQLQAGARPMIATTSRKPTKIAMQEIRTASVDVEFTTEDEFDKLTDEEKGVLP
jgi:DNA-directed RNA polymerase omega subunit